MDKTKQKLAFEAIDEFYEKVAGLSPAQIKTTATSAANGLKGVGKGIGVGIAKGAGNIPNIFKAHGTIDTATEVLKSGGHIAGGALRAGGEILKTKPLRIAALTMGGLAISNNLAKKTDQNKYS